MSNYEKTLSTSKTNLKVVKTETNSNGEEITLVRPYSTSAKSTDEIIGDLVNNFNYKTMPVKASESELNAVQQAFGSSLASELIKTYDGSNLVSDSQQDLIGERYLAEQIKLIEQQQKDSSVLKKWSHLLYEGEKYTQDEKNELTPPTESAKTSKVNVTNHVTAATEDEILESILDMIRANQNIQEQFNEEEDNKAKVEADLQRAVEAARIESDQLKEKNLNHVEETIREERDNSSYRKSEVGFTGNYLRRSTSNQYAQQPAEYLPQLSSSNLNTVSLEAYNTPQFKMMLEQMMKPMEIPVEQTTFPGEWPSAEKIAMLSEPIYIPAPLPIVIPAPNMMKKNYPDEVTKPFVTSYPKMIPSIASDQSHYQNFGIRQINM